MPRFGTSPCTVNSRGFARTAAWTSALVVGLLALGTGSASASAARLQFGAQHPPRTSAELVAPVIDRGQAPAQPTDAPATSTALA